MSYILFRSLILLALISDTLQNRPVESNGQETRNLRKVQSTISRPQRPQRTQRPVYGKGKKKDKKKDKKKKGGGKGKGKKKSKGKKKVKGGKVKSKKVPKHCSFENISKDSYQDGKCDLLLNNYECYYDGGDCYEFNTDYPNCQVLNPSYVGDNFCDGSEYNTTECGYDDGDCLMDFGCSGAANGYCENIFNTEKCDYDGGDCRDFNERFPNCKVPEPGFVGDGLCDIKPYFTEECGFDGGDCDDFPPNCTATDTYAIGDGVCHLEYNTTECEYDGGDCIISPCDYYGYYNDDVGVGGCNR